MSFLKRALGVLAAILCLALPSMAQNTLPLELVLADGTSIKIGLDDLDAMPQSEFETTTIWTNGVIRFSGVPLRAVLDWARVSGTTIELMALNDYASQISYAELTEEAPIIATRMNGNLMPVRDKGPYWVVYPYDSDPDYRAETVYSRSVWQLIRLVIYE